MVTLAGVVWATLTGLGTRAFGLEAVRRPQNGRVVVASLNFPGR